MEQKTGYAVWLCLILLVGLYLRLDNIHNQLFLASDESIYVRMAKFVNDYHILSWTHGKPLHVLLLSGLYRVFGFHLHAGAYLSAALGLMNIVVMYLLGRLLFRSAGIGLLAAAMMATSRFAVLYSKAQSTVAVAMLLVSLGVYFYYAGHLRRSRRDYGIAAFLFGLSATAHYTLVVLPVVMAVVECALYLSGAHRFKDLFQKMLLLVACFTLPSLMIESAFRYYWSLGSVKTSWLGELHYFIFEANLGARGINPDRLWEYWHLMPRFEGWVPAVLLVLAVLYAGVLYMKKRDVNALFLLAFVLVPLAAVSVMAWRGAYAAPRGMVGSYPAVYLLTARLLYDGYMQVREKARPIVARSSRTVFPLLVGGALLAWGLLNTRDLRAVTTGILPAYRYLAAQRCTVIGVVEGNRRAWQVFFDDKAVDKVSDIVTKEDGERFMARRVEGRKCMVVSAAGEGQPDPWPDRLNLPYHEVQDPAERLPAILYERGTIETDAHHPNAGILRLYVLPP